MIPPRFTLISRAFDQFTERYQKEGFGRLKWLLVKGQLTAFTFYDNDEEHEIPVKYWRHLPDPELQKVFKTGSQSIPYPIADLIEEPRQVVVKSETLLEFLKLQDHQTEPPGQNSNNEGTSREAAAKKNKGGRTPQSIELLIEAVTLIWHAKDGDYPEPVDLYKAALDSWERKNNKYLSIDTARNIITPLHKKWLADFPLD